MLYQGDWSEFATARMQERVREAEAWRATKGGRVAQPLTIPSRFVCWLKGGNMKPTRIWVALGFLALGVVGILHATGTLDANRTIDRWWPVAIIGWGLAEMLGARRYSFDATLVSAIGLAFLAEEQKWAIVGLVWSGLFLFIGAAILLSHGPKREARNGDQDSSPARSTPEGSHIARST